MMDYYSQKLPGNLQELYLSCLDKRFELWNRPYECSFKEIHISNPSTQKEHQDAAVQFFIDMKNTGFKIKLILFNLINVILKHDNDINLLICHSIRIGMLVAWIFYFFFLIFFTARIIRQNTSTMRSKISIYTRFPFTSFHVSIIFC